MFERKLVVGNFAELLSLSLTVDLGCKKDFVAVEFDK